MLVSARRERGWSQNEVAKIIGHHQQFVSRYETGERRLDVVEFVDIATLLGLNPIAMLESAALCTKRESAE